MLRALLNRYRPHPMPISTSLPTPLVRHVALASCLRSGVLLVAALLLSVGVVQAQPDDALYDVADALFGDETSQAQHASIHEAAQAGDLDAVRAFIAGGVDLNGKDDKDQTPLYLASWKGHEEVARFLLDQGAKVNARNQKDMTALHIAANRGHVDVMHLLLDRGADVHAMASETRGTPLHQASRGGDVAATALLLDSGADLQAKEPDIGNLPIHHAIQGRDYDTIELLLDRGADPNAGNTSGNTALHMAAYRDLADVARLLLVRGADPNAVGDEGDRPLHDAAQQGATATVELLLWAWWGTDTNARNDSGANAYEVATNEGHDLTAFVMLSHEDHPALVPLFLLRHVTGLDAMGPVQTDFLATVPVFEWTHPNPAWSNTYPDADMAVHPDVLVRSELGNMRTGKTTRSVDLMPSTTYTTLRHEPASGYSEWTLPDFNEPSFDRGLYFRSIEYEFALDEGTSLGDLELPFQFRTSLSPTNKVEIDLKRSGLVLIKGINTARGDTTKHWTNSPVRPDGSLSLRFVLSRMTWSVYANGTLLDVGEIDPAYVLEGRSNKFWFEGTQHIRRIALSEIYGSDVIPHARGISEESLDLVDERVARYYAEEVGEAWAYEGHERTYVRQLGVQPEDGSDASAYAVNVAVAMRTPDGERVVRPVRYELMISEADDALAGTMNLFLGDAIAGKMGKREEVDMSGDVVDLAKLDRNDFLETLEDFYGPEAFRVTTRKLFPDYVQGGKVILASDSR
jgi:ankyrin repeat protein